MKGTLKFSVVGNTYDEIVKLAWKEIASFLDVDSPETAKQKVDVSIEVQPATEPKSYKAEVYVRIR